MPGEGRVVCAHAGVGTEAEAQRDRDKRIERLGVAHDEASRARCTQRREHGRDVRHLLVVALKVEDDPDAGA